MRPNYTVLFQIENVRLINYKHLKETFPVICHHFYSTDLHRDNLIILLEQSIFIYMTLYGLGSILKAFFFFLLLLCINQVFRFLASTCKLLPMSTTCLSLLYKFLKCGILTLKI